MGNKQQLDAALSDPLFAPDDLASICSMFDQLTAGCSAGYQTGVCFIPSRQENRNDICARRSVELLVWTWELSWAPFSSSHTQPHFACTSTFQLMIYFTFFFIFNYLHLNSSEQ